MTLSSRRVLALLVVLAISACRDGHDEPLLLSKCLLLDREMRPVGKTRTTDVHRDARLLFVFTAPVDRRTVDRRTIVIRYVGPDGAPGWLRPDLGRSPGGPARRARRVSTKGRAREPQGYSVHVRVTTEVRSLYGLPLDEELSFYFRVCCPRGDPLQDEVLEKFDTSEQEDTDFTPEHARALWNAPGTEGLLVGARSPDLVSEARSRFYDTGVEKPAYLDTNMIPTAIVEPPVWEQPEGTRIEARLQGATRNLAEVTEWMQSLVDVSWYPLVRFHLVLHGNPETGEVPVVDRVILPFVFWE